MESFVIALSIVAGAIVLCFAAYLTYVIKVRLQWNNIARETALSAVKAMKAYVSRIEKAEKNSSAHPSETIRKELSELLQK